MKVYKRYFTAKEHAGDQVIIRCGEFYVTGMKSYDEIAVINPLDGLILGHITRDHLAQLKNGNCVLKKQEALLNAYKALIIEAEDGEFADMIPSTVWAIIEEEIKPAIAQASG